MPQDITQGAETGLGSARAAELLAEHGPNQLTQLLHSFSFRSETHTVFSMESLKSKWLVRAFLGSMALQMLVIYVPFMQSVFKMQPLGPHDWLVVVIASLVPVILIDITKLAVARRKGLS